MNVIGAKLLRVTRRINKRIANNVQGERGPSSKTLQIAMNTFQGKYPTKMFRPFLDCYFLCFQSPRARFFRSCSGERLPQLKRRSSIELMKHGTINIHFVTNPVCRHWRRRSPLRPQVGLGLAENGQLPTWEHEATCSL